MEAATKVSILQLSSPVADASRLHRMFSRAKDEALRGRFDRNYTFTLARKRKQLQEGPRLVSEDLRLVEKMQYLIKLSYTKIEQKRAIIRAHYERRENKPVHDPEYMTDDFMMYIRRRNRNVTDFLTLGERGVWEGFIRDIQSHWKRHESLRIICPYHQPQMIPDIAREVAKLSGAIVIALRKKRLSFLLYRGRNHRAGMLPIDKVPNLLDKQPALEKSRLQRAIQNHLDNIEKFTHYIVQLRKRFRYRDQQRKAIIDAEERAEQEAEKQRKMLLLLPRKQQVLQLTE